ncbi:hypothetical protein GCM10010404_17080 [Nonomuraea africana]|uniref:Asp23/Gls24 family envelope stress response protein n=1 Tax=Nonomuraea africana TaxID=46171 RepID=A0ABR9KLS1_9ACTN|nr:hypothetical protein [Nonomuraea africana]MBE1562955.1 hypothetical protein [Nonomuraea africana]
MTGDGLAHAIAERVRSCLGVADLSGGPFGTVATYLPGERLKGVAVRDDEVAIAIVARAGRPLLDTADEVRRAVVPLADGRLVNVSIEDLEDS